MNKCEYDIINNIQHRLKNNNYYFNNMFGTMNIGLERKNQEDSILITSHPKNNDFQMIAVADGMGGLNCGAKASNLTLYYIINWFKKLQIDFYENIDNLEESFIREITIIDEIIRQSCNGGGTTLSLAIKTKNQTLTSSIGDSRIYIYNDKLFKQINSDANIAWKLYENNNIKEKDDIRFHKKNNLLLSSVGCEFKKLNIETNKINNDLYTDLFIFTDGVTDCLSEESITEIIKSSDINYVTYNIVLNSINNNSYNLLLDDEYYNYIKGGKDNSSAVLLTKRKVKKL